MERDTGCLPTVAGCWTTRTQASVVHAQRCSTCFPEQQPLAVTTGASTECSGGHPRRTAGYNAGETDLPTLQPTHDVTNWGAVGDGRKDSTPAFEAAIKALSASSRPSVLYIPAGNYILSRQLLITKRISLLGAGSGKTTLTVSKPVGSTIRYTGLVLSKSDTLLANIAANPARGQNVLRVSQITASCARGCAWGMAGTLSCMSWMLMAPTYFTLRCAGGPSSVQLVCWQVGDCDPRRCKDP